MVAMVTGMPSLIIIPLDELLKDLNALPSDARQAIINNGGGHYNHTLYWRVMSPVSSQPSKALAEALKKEFGSTEKFKNAFIDASKKVFGSGWTWLSVDSQGKLIISTTPNQECPLSNNLIPILCLDEWEHAYYLKYKNERDAYINSWWKLVNWHYVSQLYEHAISQR